MNLPLSLTTANASVVHSKLFHHLSADMLGVFHHVYLYKGNEKRGDCQSKESLSKVGKQVQLI